jgi:ribonuclease-3
LPLFNSIKLLFIKNRRFYADLINIIGIYPGNPELYKLAFIHKSSPIKLSDGSVVNNERLEYLGDAILDAVVADYLYNIYAQKNEGFLSQMRSKIVKRKNLNLLALKIGLDRFINTHTTKNNCGKHFYGDVLEALIGVIYLDKGYKVTKRFIIKKIITNHINLNELETTESDFKSRIIEWAQKNYKEIRFESKEEYSENKTPLFISRIIVLNDLVSEGTGNSKKEAEQNAAQLAYLKLCG